MGVTERPDADLGPDPEAEPVELLRRERPRPERLAGIAAVRDHPDAGLAEVAELDGIAAAPDEDPIVRAAAIAALATMGRTVALEKDPPPAVKSAARKASAIVATRSSVAAVERGERRVPTRAATPLPATAVAIAIDPIELPDREVRRLAEASRSAGFEAGPVLGLRCQGNEFAIVFRAGMEPAGLMRAPGRPAQVAVHETEEEDTWTVPYEVLTEPDTRGALRVTVIDAQGDPQFVGRASVDGSVATFEVDAVSRPGASPATIRGRLVDSRVVIDEARAGPRGVPARQPRSQQGGGS